MSGMSGWARTDRPGVRVKQMNISKSPSNKKADEDEACCVSSEKVESIVSCEAWKCRKPLHARTLKPSEFFLYLYSDCWDDGCILRVSEGQLLDELLTALYLMVNTETVVTHNTYAFARDVPLKKGGYAGKENTTYQNLVFEFVHFGRLCKESPNQSRQSPPEPIPVQTKVSRQKRVPPDKTESVSGQKRVSLDKTKSVSRQKRVSLDKTESALRQKLLFPDKTESVSGHNRLQAKEKPLSAAAKRVKSNSRLGVSRSDSRLSETESVFPLARSRGSMVYVTSKRPNLGETFSSDTEIDAEEQLILAEARVRNIARELKKKIKVRLTLKKDKPSDNDDPDIHGKELSLLDVPSVVPKPKAVKFLFEDKKQQLIQKRQQKLEFIKDIEEAMEVIKKRKPTFPPSSEVTEKLPHLWYHTGLPDKLPSFETMVKIMKDRDPRFQNIVDRHARKVVAQYTHQRRKQEPLQAYLRRSKTPVMTQTVDTSIPEDTSAAEVQGVTDSIPCKEHYIRHTGSPTKSKISPVRHGTPPILKGTKRISPLQAKAEAAEAVTSKPPRKISPKIPVINLIRASGTNIKETSFHLPEGSMGGGVGKVSRFSKNKKVRIFTPRMFPKAPLCLDDDSGSEDLEGNIDQADIDAESKFDTRKLKFRYSFEELHKKRLQNKMDKFEEHIANQEVTPGTALSATTLITFDVKETNRKRAQTLPDLKPSLKGFKALKQGPVRSIRTDQTLYKTKTRGKKQVEEEDIYANTQMVIGKLRSFYFTERKPFRMKRRSTGPDSDPGDASRPIVVDLTDDLNNALDNFVITKEVVVSEHHHSSLTAQVSLTFTRNLSFVINKTV